MCYQERQEKEESELFQEHIQEEGIFESGAIHHLSMLHLNTADKHRPTTTTTENCTACGGSMKRPSPSFVSSLPEPSPKRVTLLPPSPATAAVSGAAATNSATIGSKPLPSLHRSFSDPTAALEFQPPLRLDLLWRHKPSNPPVAPLKRVPIPRLNLN